MKDKYVFNLKKNKQFSELPSLGEQLSYKVSLESGDTKAPGRLLLAEDFMTLTQDGWFSAYALEYSQILDCKVSQKMTMGKSYHANCCVNFESKAFNSQSSPDTVICRKFTGIQESLELQAYCFYFFNQVAQDIEAKCKKTVMLNAMESAPLQNSFKKDPALLSQQLASLSQ